MTHSIQDIVAVVQGYYPQDLNSRDAIQVYANIAKNS